MISKQKITLTTISFLLILSSCSPKKEQENSHKNQNEADRTVAVHDELTPLDIPAIKNALRMKGTEYNGEYKVTVPQNDLKVTVDGFKIIPQLI